MKDFKNILIVRTDRIGDVVLTTPAITSLRKAYPDARLSVMVEPFTREIVQGNPCIDEVIVYRHKKIHSCLKRYLEFIFLLRKKKFDLAIVLHTKKRTNLVCFLAGIPIRVGYRNNKFGFLLTHKVKDLRAQGTKHEYEYCLDVLKHLGIQERSDKLVFPLNKDGEIWAEDFIFNNHLKGVQFLIAVHSGASCVSKRWPVDHFIDLINCLQNEFPAKVVLIGGQDNRLISDQIKYSVQEPIVDANGQTSLGGLASLLRRCDLLISNDSGPVHVAVAVGTPVISIFGRNQEGLSPVRWRPIGPRDVVLHQEVGCEVCLAHNCQIDFECLRAIQVEDVLKAVRLMVTQEKVGRIV